MRFILRVMGSVLVLGLLGMARSAIPVAAAPFAYVTNSIDATVSVIDTATNTVVSSPIAVGGSPLGVAITPDGTRAYVTSHPFDNTVSVIATATNTVVSTIPMGGGPEGVAITPDGTRAYVANSFDNTVSVIATATNTVVGSPIPVGSQPIGVAITPDGTRAYVTNFNGGNGTTVSVIATATNTVVGSPIPVGRGPYGVAITPAAKPGNKCPLNQGFWQNHTGAWPVTTLTLGGKTYSQTELLAILDTPVRGDASLILADQLIAAKLNIANGADPTPISTTIADADRLLSGFTGKLPYHVRPSSSIGQAMVNNATVLDSYNNGELTPDCTH